MHVILSYTWSQEQLLTLSGCPRVAVPQHYSEDGWMNCCTAVFGDCQFIPCMAYFQPGRTLLLFEIGEKTRQTLNVNTTLSLHSDSSVLLPPLVSGVWNGVQFSHLGTSHKEVDLITTAFTPRQSTG